MVLLVDNKKQELFMVLLVHNNKKKIGAVHGFACTQQESASLGVHGGLDGAVIAHVVHQPLHTLTERWQVLQHKTMYCIVVY